MRKVCLVTGATSGVGKAVAEGLASLGADVIIAARDARRGEDAAASLRAATGNQRVFPLVCDLADLASVRSAVETCRERFERLDVLAQAAGIVAWKRGLTADGYERVFATNYLGHALLAILLLDPLSRSGSGRIVTVTGAPWTLARTRLDLEDMAERRTSFAPARVALQTMLARMVWTTEAARRWRDRGITVNAFFPGGVRSRLQRNLPLPLRLAIGLVSPLLSTRCPSGVDACLSPALEGISGRVVVGRRVVPFSNPHCGPEVAERLWSLTAEILGT